MDVIPFCAISPQWRRRENRVKENDISLSYVFVRLGFRLCCFCCFILLVLSPAFSASIVDYPNYWVTENLDYSAPVGPDQPGQLVEQQMLVDGRKLIEDAYLRDFGELPPRIEIFMCWDFYYDLDEQGCFIYGGQKYCYNYDSLKTKYGPDVFKSVKRVYERFYGSCAPDWFEYWCGNKDEYGYPICDGPYLRFVLFEVIPDGCGFQPLYVTDGRTIKQMLSTKISSASSSVLSMSLDELTNVQVSQSKCPVYKITIPPLFGYSSEMSFDFDFLCWDFFISFYSLAGYFMLMFFSYIAVRIALGG